MKKIFVCLVFLSVSALAVFAQGGKAEPKKINFPKGKSSTVLTGVLSNNQVMEYVFSARKGQNIKLKVSSIPKGNFFDFSLKGDGFDLQTELDAYYDYEFTAPETGNYFVFVRKMPTDKIKKAKFYFSISIK